MILHHISHVAKLDQFESQKYQVACCEIESPNFYMKSASLKLQLRLWFDFVHFLLSVWPALGVFSGQRAMASFRTATQNICGFPYFQVLVK